MIKGKFFLNILVHYITFYLLVKTNYLTAENLKETFVFIMHGQQWKHDACQCHVTFCRAKWNLAKLKLSQWWQAVYLICGGTGRSSRGHVMCFACNELLACLFGFPSLSPSLLGQYTFHTLSFHSAVLTGAWRLAVSGLPWWPPCCRGDRCSPFLLPLRHLNSNISSKVHQLWKFCGLIWHPFSTDGR